jgi:hypothetical protein
LAWRGIEVGPVGVVVVEGKIELHLESTQLGVSAKHAGRIRSARVMSANALVRLFLRAGVWM